MLTYIILDSMPNTIGVFCVCDNRGESRFPYSDKPVEQIACVFYACDNRGESEFQYPIKPLEQIVCVFCVFNKRVESIF